MKRYAGTYTASSKARLLSPTPHPFTPQKSCKFFVLRSESAHTLTPQQGGKGLGCVEAAHTLAPHLEAAHTLTPQEIPHSKPETPNERPACRHLQGVTPGATVLLRVAAINAYGQVQSCGWMMDACYLGEGERG